MDNDPHFIVHLPRNNMDVCFNINSRPGHILNLVSDRGTGRGQVGDRLHPRVQRLANANAAALQG